ncbi:hypothetical protein HK102_000927 [Quaeritorhiza haematococci]|nr:hypothetical protein HK102_000927 [Quaeritorhiza haematococci]
MASNPPNRQNTSDSRPSAMPSAIEEQLLAYRRRMQGRMGSLGTPSTLTSPGDFIATTASSFPTSNGPTSTTTSESSPTSPSSRSSWLSRAPAAVASWFSPSDSDSNTTSPTTGASTGTKAVESTYMRQIDDDRALAERLMEEERASEERRRRRAEEDEALARELAKRYEEADMQLGPLANVMPSGNATAGSSQASVQTRAATEQQTALPTVETSIDELLARQLAMEGSDDEYDSPGLPDVDRSPFSSVRSYTRSTTTTSSISQSQSQSQAQTQTGSQSSSSMYNSESSSGPFMPGAFPENPDLPPGRPPGRDRAELLDLLGPGSALARLLLGGPAGSGSTSVRTTTTPFGTTTVVSIGSGNAGVNISVGGGGFGTDRSLFGNDLDAFDEGDFLQWRNMFLSRYGDPFFGTSRQFPTTYEGLLELAEQLGPARPRGASKEQIANVPVVKWNKGSKGSSSKYAASSASEEESKACAICMSDFENGEDVMIMPKCMHQFVNEAAEAVDSVELEFHYDS